MLEVPGLGVALAKSSEKILRKKKKSWKKKI